MIHFIRPLWLWSFIPICIYLIWIIFSSRQFNPWEKICDAHLLKALLQKNKRTSHFFFHMALVSFFSMAIFALAGPSWKKTNLPVYREISSLMLVLDLSAAMEINDLKPNRLSRAKFKIRDLINASQNSQMGLVVFSSEAFVVSPVSQDVNTLTALLDELSPQMMPISGSDMGEGLDKALTLLTQTGNQNDHSIQSIRGSHHVILITASEPTAKSWIAAQKIRESNNQFSILALLDANAENQARITDLKELAKVGGGSLYLFNQDNSDIQLILSNNNTTQALKDQNIKSAEHWLDAGPWFCLLLTPLALLILREKVL